MSGKKHRQKGDRLEREMVKRFQDIGLRAQRVPLSGATDFAKGDVVVFADKWTDLGINIGSWLTGECKARKTLPSYYADYLKNADFAVLKADRQDPVILLNFKTFVELLGGKFDGQEE